jgi:hypothetical protein
LHKKKTAQIEKIFQEKNNLASLKLSNYYGLQHKLVIPAPGEFFEDSKCVIGIVKIIEYQENHLIKDVQSELTETSNWSNCNTMVKRYYSDATRLAYLDFLCSKYLELTRGKTKQIQVNQIFISIISGAPMVCHRNNQFYLAGIYNNGELNSIS